MCFIIFVVLISSAEVGNYNYGVGHPMKPHRIRMTNDLVINYGLYQHLQVYVRTIRFKYHLSLYIFTFKASTTC